MTVRTKQTAMTFPKGSERLAELLGQHSAEKGCLLELYRLERQRHLETAK